MLKLKLQSFGHLIQTLDSLEKTLILGKIEGRKRRGWQRMRWLDGISDSVDISWGKLKRWWGTEKPDMLQRRVRHDLVTEQKQWYLKYLFLFSTTQVYILYIKLIIIWPVENGQRIDYRCLGMSNLGKLVADVVWLLILSLGKYVFSSIAILCLLA